MRTVRLPNQPYVLPVSLDALAVHLRLADDAQGLTDGQVQQLTRLALAASQLWETATRQAVMEAQYVSVVSSWSGEVKGLRGPVRAVSRITYRTDANVVDELLDTDYELSVLASDTLLLPTWRELPRIYPAAAEPVIIYYTAGAVTPDEVPPMVQEFICLMTAHWYENPAAALVGGNYSELPLGAQDLINWTREPLL